MTPSDGRGLLAVLSQRERAATERHDAAIPCDAVSAMTTPATVDVLQLRVEPAQFPSGAARQLVPYINGRSLLELHEQARTNKAGRGSKRGSRSGRRSSGQAGLAVYGPSVDVSDLRPEAADETPVLGCVCGEAGCHPVMAEISASESVVTWRLRRLTFRFDRNQYDQALASAQAQVLR